MCNYKYNIFKTSYKINKLINIFIMKFNKKNIKKDEKIVQP